MNSHRITQCLKAFTIIGYLLYSIPVHAQLSAAVHYKPMRADTSADVITDYDVKKTSVIINKTSVPAEGNINFLENMETHLSSRQERKALMGYLKEFSTGSNEVNYNRSRVKIYYKLANVFARLRMYPLAMKCFFKTMQYKKDSKEPALQIRPVVDSVSADTLSADSGLSTRYLAINAKDDSLFVNDPKPLALNDKAEEKSKAVTYQRIVNTFNDGKKAVAYALLFHVKQPVPGKPRIFKIVNTGHTFITLIKYNTDSTSVSISFGFYPQKDNLFSATPLDPSCSGTFKNDNGHNWDEVMGKFISKKRFDKILLLTKSYDGLEYHLSKNNCTDFAIKAASYAGIGVADTKGSWPLGHGNNPGITGQSIISGGVYNTEGKDSLFIDFDAALGK
ncbi:hypothetical protein [Mucilaginibacter sp. OK283]|uniref:hypothetical protein n=1 Tax=Mucilaginibacter sp. OK283 TaxID=1881049 RepID=UPI0008CF1C90|nr:hypothetical protein [Mucilaginibacter sp. OK283]SEP43022.1 hypothetical protein SAMN05428947_11744 [Mucilaginibacter sp. OK283]